MPEGTWCRCSTFLLGVRDPRSTAHASHCSGTTWRFRKQAERSRLQRTAVATVLEQVRVAFRCSRSGCAIDLGHEKAARTFQHSMLHFCLLFKRRECQAVDGNVTWKVGSWQYLKPIMVN